mgnify:CR=1 FL=1
MEPGIQVHLAGLSLSNTITVLERLGVKKSEISERTKIGDFRRVKRVRSTVHNWVHKADLQPDEGRSPNQVAVDETMIRHNGRWQWLYIGYQKSLTSGCQTRAKLLFIDPDTNNILHTKLQPTRNHYTAKGFFHEPIEKHDIDNSMFC